ncbi:MAG: amidophosphoribosyltransferase, partial [Kiritimatiellae bacterium]|nr:amidophosphoribosyltransferase [Kiritimatiellia bacterium]
QEGEDADISKYADPDGEPYRRMVEYIRQTLDLTSLAFQRLEDLVAAIGLPKERLCTYCFDGKDVSEKCRACPHACAAAAERAR